MKFHGTFDELKVKLAPLNLDGEWREMANGISKF